MADVIQVQRGSSPWKPSPTAELVAQYHYYNVPTIGVVSDHGVDYYFSCVSGQDDPVSVWFYARIDARERQAFEDAHEQSDIDNGFRALWGRPGLLALALEGAGILTSRVIEAVTEDDVGRALDAMSSELAELIGDAAHGVALPA